MPLKQTKRKAINRASATVVLIILVAAFGFPFFWMILTSFKPTEEVFVYPPKILPEIWHLINYVEAATMIPYFRYLWNTVYIAIVWTSGILFCSTFTAYGFSRIRWKGRDIFFYIMLATMMVPFQVILIPLFVMYSKIHWVGTLKPLTWPGFLGFSGAFYIFLMRQFFMTLPKDLEDAAKIDGCNELQVFYRIMLPLVKPGLAAVVLFCFVAVWNDFLEPLVYINSQEKYTLALGIYDFAAARFSSWPRLMASAIQMSLPVVIVFFFVQRTFIQGITLTGIKG